MTIAVGSLSLDPETGRADFRGVVAELTGQETTLLSFLIRASPAPHTSRQLLRLVWGYPPYIGNGVVARTHVCNIRKKLGADCIRHRRGWGYYVPT